MQIPPSVVVDDVVGCASNWCCYAPCPPAVLDAERHSKHQGDCGRGGEAASQVCVCARCASSGRCSGCCKSRSVAVVPSPWPALCRCLCRTIRVQEIDPKPAVAETELYAEVSARITAGIRTLIRAGSLMRYRVGSWSCRLR